MTIEHETEAVDVQQDMIRKSRARRIGGRFIMEYLPEGRLAVPLLCVSDTHLGVEDARGLDDDPEGLLALIEAYPRHQIYVLGDFVESYARTGPGRKRLLSSRRLARLFTTLQMRGAHVLVGNHDKFAVNELIALFGENAIRHPTGSLLGRLRLLHGDTWQRCKLPGEALWGDVAARTHAWFQRHGIKLPGEPANEAIVSRRPTGEYWIFGHTHAPTVRPHYANSGCFLRTGRRTFITVDFHELALWEWVRS